MGFEKKTVIWQYFFRGTNSGNGYWRYVNDIIRRVRRHKIVLESALDSRECIFLISRTADNFFAYFCNLKRYFEWFCISLTTRYSLSQKLRKVWFHCLYKLETKNILNTFLDYKKRRKSCLQHLKLKIYILSYLKHFQSLSYVA